MRHILMELMKSAVGSAWEMGQLVDGAVGILIDDKDHCKRRSTGGEGGNKVWALGVALRVVKTDGDLPLYRGVWRRSP